MNLELVLKKTFSLPSIIAVVCLSVYFFVYGFIPGWENVNSDFPNYYTSSKLLIDGESTTNIYNDDWFQNKITEYGITERGKYSPFSPVTSFVMLIPSVFSPITAKRIYLVLNLLILLLTAYYFFKITKISFINCLNIILFGGVSLINNFLLGQFYLIMLFLIVLGYYFIEVKKSFYGGLIWGAGAAIKYFPLIFIPAFFQRDNRKVILGIFSSLLLLNLIGLYTFGTEVYKDFFLTAFLPHLNGELSNQSQFAHQFQSWNSFLRNVFVFNPVENPTPIINWELGFTIVRAVIYLTVILFTTISFIKLKNHSEETILKISLLSVVMLLLSPASASYHFLLLSFPTILLLVYSIKNNQQIYGLIFLCIYTLIGFLPVVLHRIISNYDSNLFFSFHRLWLITFYFVLLSYFLIIKTGQDNISADKECI